MKYRVYTRGLSLIIAMIMVVTMFPIRVFAQTEASVPVKKTGTMVVGNANQKRGDIFDVDISLCDNPGVMSMRFALVYDDTALTLTNVKYNAAIADDAEKPDDYSTVKSPFILYWENSNDVNYDVDGVFATVTFTVAEDAPIGKSIEFRVIYDPDEIYDVNENNVSFDTIPGKCIIVDCRPGDINGDGKANSKDVTRLRRYYAQSSGGDSVEVNLSAMDVNGDGKTNSKDVTRLRRYYAGQDVEIHCVCTMIRCSHTLNKVIETAATCTEPGNIEYWTCTKCNKLYEDEAGVKEIKLEDTFVEAKGHTYSIEWTTDANYHWHAATCGCDEVSEYNTHTEIAVPGYPSTEEKEGLTDGIKCSICDTILKEQEKIDPPKPEEYLITYKYRTNFGTDYFEKQVKNNNNPDRFTAQSDSITLEDVHVPGFKFNGWYDSKGVQWDAIPKGTKTDLILYGDYTREVYTVSFDTKDVDVTYEWYDDANATNVKLKNYAKYTVDTGLSLPNPDKDSTGKDLVYGYSFVGWSNDNGFIVNSIKKGETGNKTFHANWISDRNKATSYAEYDSPIIIEDTDNGQFVFVYNIGRIDNVPLTEYTDLDGNSLFATGGLPLNVTITERKTSKFEESTAKEIAKTVANATTKSSGWTLSEDWNAVYGESEDDRTMEYASTERTDTNGNKVGGEYFISNSNSGSTYTSNESGSSSSNSAKITTEDSVGISSSYDSQTKKYADAELSVENKTEAEAGLKFPIEFIDVSAGVKNTTTVGSKISSGRSDEEHFHIDGNMSSYIGTENYDSSSKYNVSVEKGSNSWNTQNSYKNSHEYSTEEKITNAIAEEIEKTRKYSFSNSFGGETINNVSDLESNSKEETYSSTVVVANLEENEITKEYTFKNDAPGYYRLMRAGTIHVYAVVGFDVATSSYYTYTYNVLDDKTYDFMDFSANGNFNDCENSVVTFEVPYEVNEYVIAMTAKTDGLEFTNGKVTKFETPVNFDGNVIIPSYSACDPVGDVYEAYQTVELAEGLFENKTEITTVILPPTVSVIPKNAFKGCTNLKNVIAFGVTEIGENAFSGCENLLTFMVDNKVSSIGKEAFLNVPSIKVMAKDSTVAMQAIESGAKSIVVDFGKTKDNFENKTILAKNTTAYLGLQASGKDGPKEFVNVKVKSDAKETFISNIIFKDNGDKPLEISSEKLTLASVTVEDAPGLALVLSSENTSLVLHKDVVLNSDSDIVVLSKNVDIKQAVNSTGSSLRVNGEILVCGEVTDERGLLVVSDGKNNTYETIDDKDYEKYLTYVTVTFNKNIDDEPPFSIQGNYVRIPYGTKVKQPTDPIYEKYEFFGWYTDKECTNLFNFNSNVVSDITLYAKWKLNLFTVTFNPNGGKFEYDSAATGWEYVTAYGEALGNPPKVAREGFEFIGWFDENGNQIDAETKVYEDFTVKARWLSDYVEVDKAPAGAEIEAEKWTYDLTTRILSDESEVDGFVLYDTTSKWGEYSEWSAWQDASITDSDSVKVETRTVYPYCFFACPNCGHHQRYSGNCNKGCGVLVYWDLIWSTTPWKTDKELVEQIVDGQTVWTALKQDGTLKTQYRSCTRELVYKYYLDKTEAMESEVEILNTELEQPTVDTPQTTQISNVQKWVKYIVK